MECQASGAPSIHGSLRGALIFLAGAAVSWSLSGCAPPAASGASESDRAVAKTGCIDEDKVIDLTHAFNARSIYWPTADPFELERVAFGENDRGQWYAANNFAAAEHGGTHLDAPIHFARGRRTTEEIPLRQLMGPALVIDIRRQCESDRDYRLSERDVLDFEQLHGRIPAGAIVLIHTGWGRYWPDKARYLGSDAPGDASDLHFPGIGPDAARLLVERGIDLVGLDTASLDHGPSKDFTAHRILNDANIPGLENVANLDRLPPTGATVIALPMKIEGGTGGPCWIMAILP